MPFNQLPQSAHHWYCYAKAAHHIKGIGVIPCQAIILGSSTSAKNLPLLTPSSPLSSHFNSSTNTHRCPTDHFLGVKCVRTTPLKSHEYSF
jgi:hypothetical protein